MVPTRSVPEAYSGVAAPPPRWLTDLLAAQLDLQRIDTDRSLLVYRNTAWRGMARAVPAGTELPDDQAGAVGAGLEDVEDVVTGQPDHDRYRVDVPAEVDVVAAVPADGWRLDVDGGTDASGEAFGWAARYDEPGAGEGTLAYATPIGNVALILLQPVLWILALLARSRMLSRARRRAHADRPAPAGPVPVVDPVEAAAAAVAALAERAVTKDPEDDA
jgi:hypothetical protein